MLSPDPVKRGLNPYPYYDNDPVNYVDSEGEIPTIFVGAGLGGFFGGAAGFVGSVLSQVTDGRKIDWRKAAGSAANGVVVGAAKGALAVSGAGIPLAFATDFAAGSIGDALEQKITTGRVDLGKSLRSGAENALSEMLYGTGELDGIGDAIRRGAKTGAVMSGLKNLTDAFGGYGLAGDRIFGRKPKKSIMTGITGRDPKRMCGSPDPFDLAQGLGNGRGYHSGSAHGEGGFSLGGLLKDVVIGGILGGLGSAGFYGAGKALDALHESFVGRSKVVPKPNHGQGFSKKGYNPKPGERTFEGYVRNNADPEVSLYTRAKGFNNGRGKSGGQFKRLGAQEHYKLSPHVHQPVRNVAPDGTIYGGTGKTVGVDTLFPNEKDIKQLYEYLNNGKYHR